MLIIVPNYNKAEYINQTLESLKAQTYKDWACLINDDRSADDSVLVIERHLNDPRFRFARNLVNLGISKNLNKCFTFAKEEGHDFAVILASDDLVDSSWLDKMINLQRETKADFVSTAGSRFGDMVGDFNECSAGMYSVKMWHELQGRDEWLPHVADIDMKLRMYKQGYKKRLVKDKLYHWRMYPEQDSRNAGNTDMLLDSLRLKYGLSKDEYLKVLTQEFN